MIEVLLTRLVRIVLAMPIVVVVLGAGWWGATVATRAGWEAVVTTGVNSYHRFDCAPDIDDQLRRIRRHAPGSFQGRWRWVSCGESPDGH